VLEFEAVQSLKEILPVYVAEDGVLDPDTAEWLLSRSQRVKHEDRDPAPTIPTDGQFDAAVATANGAALERLLARQREFEEINRERVRQERAKIERFYAYKRVAAGEKVTSVRRTLERLAESDEPDVQKILPVWRKNLENAERDLAVVDVDRERRLASIAGRETVSAQTQLLTASRVAIREPDVAPE
jgi:hypothetical protein